MERLIYFITGCLSVLLNQRIDQQFISQSRRRLLFVLAHNYDNSSCTLVRPTHWLLDCNLPRLQATGLIVPILQIDNKNKIVIFTFDYLLHLFHSFKKLWQASQHEASLPPNFSTFLWQILSRSRPQILKYFKQKPQLNLTRLKYFFSTFTSDPNIMYYYHNYVPILNYLLIPISIISSQAKNRSNDHQKPNWNIIGTESKLSASPLNYQQLWLK